MAKKIPNPNGKKVVKDIKTKSKKLLRVLTLRYTQQRENIWCALLTEKRKSVLLMSQL